MNSKLSVFPAIFTYDGKIMATSEPLYGIYMDFRAGGMIKDTLYAKVSGIVKFERVEKDKKQSGELMTV